MILQYCMKIIVVMIFCQFCLGFKFKHIESNHLVSNVILFKPILIKKETKKLLIK